MSAWYHLQRSFHRHLHSYGVSLLVEVPKAYARRLIEPSKEITLIRAFWSKFCLCYAMPSCCLCLLCIFQFLLHSLRLKIAPESSVGFEGSSNLDCIVIFPLTMWATGQLFSFSIYARRDPPTGFFCGYMRVLSVLTRFETKRSKSKPYQIQFTTAAELHSRGIILKSKAHREDLSCTTDHFGRLAVKDASKCGLLYALQQALCEQLVLIYVRGSETFVETRTSRSKHMLVTGTLRNACCQLPPRS
ncbi:hypothetical protein F4782DRAFT_388489 [Xylaria castorea]|nr:hypothetical protein F4782DRAFT_388489 [Xylaria castorea]